jgi:outer membrane protein OmpA-like peptidoglycan-associated protein
MLEHSDWEGKIMKKGVFKSKMVLQGAAWAGVLLGAVWLGAGPAWGAGEGTTAAPFLKIGTSSRAEGMGGAFTAVANDVDASYYNPAGLSQLRRSTVGLSHMEWFQGIRYESIDYADKFDNIGAIGINLGYLYMGDIPKTLETSTGDYDTNSSGTFGASDLLGSISWAGSIFMRENKIGVSVKVIQESIDSSQSFSVGLDLGDQVLLSRMRWYRDAAKEGWAVRLIPSAVGISVKNLGTPVKYTYQNDPLPMMATAGLAYQFMDDDLTFVADEEMQITEGVNSTHVGAEYWIRTGQQSGQEDSFDIALRAGYRTGYDASSAPGFSVGAGLVFSSLGLDYAYMPFGDLGVTHRISLKYSWGAVLKDKIVKRRVVVKKQISASDQALQETADEMMKSKKSMEGKTVVKKTQGNKRELTEVEAKRPEGEAVAKESKTLGGDVTGTRGGANVAPISKTALIQGTTPGSKTDASALIAQITKGARTPGSSRTQSQYTRRTSDDAVRAAKAEAENKNTAFDDVEAAAQQESQQTKNGAEKMVTKTTVYFAKDSENLNDKYLFALDQIAVTFDKNPQRTILVHGYASAGEKSANSLSLKRAKAVKDYFVQIKSLPSSKISLKGFGDKDPAAGNDTEKGMAMNRRVRVQIITSGN